jgi:hypothetical protein
MSQATWVDALAVDDLPADDVMGLQVEGRDIALYTVGSEVYATDNTCTHGQARLCDGFLEGHEIECPLHQATLNKSPRGRAPSVWDGLQGANHSHSSCYGEDLQRRRPPKAGVRDPRGTCSALP